MTSHTGSTFAPPIPEARKWLEGVTFSADRPLLNLSQAAPADPPPPAMRAAMAEFLDDANAHLYGPVLGLTELRAELARNWSAHYGGTIDASNIAITAGCNQAFAATIAALCGDGDEVIIPTPWYFNHKMWLDMSSVTAVPMPAGDTLIPSACDARTLITSRTRAIALVSPNNPTGIEYPADTLAAFYDLCRAAGIKLILDETYRDFDSRTGAPHDLVGREDRADVLVQLYSFSKTYRLTGHRVGAIIAAPALLAEIEKFQDTVAICAPSFGQMAALWGLQNLSQWVAGERDEILSRRAAIAAVMPQLAPKGWRLRGLGAYFAYLEHPFALPAEHLAPLMVREAAILALPATMFAPPGDPHGQRHLRVAFANIDTGGIAEMANRLAALSLPLAPGAGTT